MDDKHLQKLKEFLKFKSISARDEFLEEMEKTRQFLTLTFEEMGFKTQVLPGQKHHAVFAEKVTDPKLPTLLIYGHYDVQPVEPLEEWRTPPFEPTVIDNKIYARGATDNKGQAMIHTSAVKYLIEEHGQENLPVNFKFLLEGEEEIGSISIEALAKEYKNLLQCDYILVSDSEMVGPGKPAIDNSLRGLLYTEIFLESAEQDVHSGQLGGIAENPAIVLARIITELKDKNEKVKIPNFYKDVVDPTKKELEDYQALETSKEQLMEEGKLFGIGGGENEFSLNERRWSRPTLDVNGIQSGYIGEGSKTIIPAKASAKISMRLVPNQDPKKVFADFEKFVTKLVPSHIRLKIVRHADALPYKAPTDHPIFNLVKQSLEKSFGTPAVFQGVGGSIGFVPIVAGTLNVPCIMIGFGLATENIHAPNEHLNLDNFYKGIEAMTEFYNRFAKTVDTSTDVSEVRLHTSAGHKLRSGGKLLKKTAAFQAAKVYKSLKSSYKSAKND